MSVSIRKAVPEDAPALAQMRWDDSMEGGAIAPQLYAEFTANFAEFVRDALAGGQWTIWLAESGGRVIAHIYLQVIAMVPRPGRPGRRWGYVAGVYTVPEERNQGAGTRLLQSVIDRAREEGLESLLLWPSERSVSFYERAGFVHSPDILELQLDT